MPIKLTGPLSLQDIVDEFGGEKPHDIKDYYRGGDFVPNKNANANIPLQGSGQPISIGDFYGATKIITLSYKAYGGGGAGGSGFENGGENNNTNAGSGYHSGIMTKAEFNRLKSQNGGVAPSFIPIDSFLPATNIARSGGASTATTAANGRATGIGGRGGENGAFTSANASAGDDSAFGAGGAAGARNSAGSSPTWGHWGAGGGGGGGDQGKGDNYFIVINYGGGDDWGAAGEGGKYTGEWTGKIDMDVEVDYVVVMGKGGYPSVSVGNHDGGYGNPGYVEFSIDALPGQTFSFSPSGTGTNADRNKTYFKGFRINRNSTVDIFNV